MGKWQSIDKLFDGLHFDREVIVLCVRWYSAVGQQRLLCQALGMDLTLRRGVAASRV